MIGIGISEETKYKIKKICEEQERKKEDNILNEIVNILKYDGYEINVYDKDKNDEFWSITSFDLPVDILNIRKKDLINISLSAKRFLIELLVSYAAGYSRSLFSNSNLNF